MKASYMKTTNMCNPTDIFIYYFLWGQPSHPLPLNSYFPHSQDVIPKLVIMTPLHSKARNLQISDVLMFVFRIEKQGGPVAF